MKLNRRSHFFNELFEEVVESSVSYHSIQYHTIQYHIIPHNTIPYPTRPCPTVPYRTVPYPTLPYPTLPYPTIPYLQLHASLFHDFFEEVVEGGVTVRHHDGPLGGERVVEVADYLYRHVSLA